MPIYCYRRGDGELVEISMSYAEKCRREQGGRIVHKGETLERDVVAEHSKTVPGCSGWPIWSESAAVHPSDVPQVKSDLARNGIACDFDRHGRPRFESAAHRRSVLRRWGMHDRRGYD
jgi:hypothetical protein